MRLTVFLIFLLASLTLAQGKKSITMAVFGDEPAKFKALKPLKAKLEKAFLKEGGYKVTDRSDAILNFLKKDFEYLPGTFVLDEDARQINDLYKTQYICIVESSNTGDGYFVLSARLVSASEGEHPTEATVQSKLLTQQDINQAGDMLVIQLLKLTGGVFIDQSYKMNPLSQEFSIVLKKRISFKDGYCGAGGLKVQIDTTEPICNETRNTVSCTIDVSLEGFSCTNEGEVHLKGSVSATDRSKAAAITMAKKELLNGKAYFIKDWVSELSEWNR